jgi:serine O-acetyltransferase
MFEIFQADLSRYRSNPKAGFQKNDLYLFFEQGIWAIAVYRFSQWIRKIPVPVLSHILKLLAYLLFKLMEILTGISLPASAQIGKGFYVGHFGATILHSDVVIGEGCSVGPGVIIGTRGMGKQGTPILGNNVYVGTGAKILGAIKIGNNVSIGANAVVLVDIPDGATAVGIPAKVIKIDKV